MKNRRPRLTKAELELLGVVRCFERYTSEQRANHANSRRLGYQQRIADGHYYYVTSLVPGLAFDTQWQAVNAARAALGIA